MAINLSDSIRVGQQKPIDDKYYNGLQPYVDEVEVCSLLPSSLRYRGLTVNISGDEYWFKEGILDTDLILKESGGGIESVTGDLVDNTDPLNPIINTPNITLEQARQNGNVLEGSIEITPFNDNVIYSEYTDPENGYFKLSLDLSYDLDGSGGGLIREGYGYESLFLMNDSNLYVISDNPNYLGIVGSEEFDKQGDRKAFAQIADLEDALDNLPSFLQLGDTSTTAYWGDRGKTAYDHSQETGNPHKTTLQQVVDEDGTVEDKSVSFTSATPDSQRVTIDNEQVKVENVTDVDSIKIGFRDIEFEHGGNKLTISPLTTIDDDYIVSIQAKDHTLAGLDDIVTEAVDIEYDNTTSGLDATNVQDAIDEISEIAVLTNDDNTLIIDENIIRLNVTNVEEVFTANGTDRNFTTTEVFASFDSVFINGVKIRKTDFSVISDQEIEIEETVTLLEDDIVEIQGTMFIN